MSDKDDNTNLVTLSLQGKLLILVVATFSVISLFLNNYVISEIGITYYLIYMLVCALSILVIVFGFLIYLLPFLKEGKLFQKDKIAKVQISRRFKNTSWSTFIIGFAAFYINTIILCATLLVRISQVI